MVVGGSPWRRHQRNKINKLGVRLSDPSKPGTRVWEAARVERRTESSVVRRD